MGRKGPTKLHAPWKGPMKVVNMFGNEYTVLNLVTLKEEKVHVTSLKPFKWDAKRTDPREVALRDAGCYDVENVVSHTYENKNKISTYMFEIKWIGYDKTSNTMEPWKNVMHTEAVHKYLKQHGLQKFIPPRYRS